MSFFLRALVTLLTVVDPVGLAPLVVGLTSDMPAHDRARTVTRAAIIAAVVVAFFSVLGRTLLDALGISFAAFSIAGGGLLFLVAIEMLFGREPGTRETPREAEESRHRGDISVFPLAIPLIAGPGTITTVILLAGDTAGQPARWLGLTIAVALTLVAAWVAMRLSVQVFQRVGATGSTVLARIEGMLLAALAVEFVLDGIARFLARV